MNLASQAEATSAENTASPPHAAWPGSHYPMGATYDGVGTNFSVFSEVAERVELCLFDEQDNFTDIEYMGRGIQPRGIFAVRQCC